jgi:DNA-binding transcriptional ArsR family regulator
MAESPIEGSLSPLKHVMRRQLLRSLNESEDARTPQSLAGQMRKGITTVSYHLRALKIARMALVSHRSENGTIEPFYDSAVRDDEAVAKILAETAEADERILPRNPA